MQKTKPSDALRLKVQQFHNGACLRISRRMLTSKPTDDITRGIIGAAIAVHDQFGPGLFEQTYIPPMVWELHGRGLRCEAREEATVASVPSEWTHSRLLIL